jgi:hypothetical protein
LPKYTERLSLVESYFNPDAELPYGLTVTEVKAAINAAYDLLHDVNTFLVGRGYSRLEDLLLGNAFAGLLSEVLVKNLADHSPALVHNTYVGGYPDLILPGVYPDDAALKATDGIEVKASKQKGGWQGHNPEEGWVMVFRYTIDTKTMPIEDREPTEVVEVLAAQLEMGDWNFSGRSETSRRTITASINRYGMQKLRANPIYRHPSYAVGRRRTRRQS